VAGDNDVTRKSWRPFVLLALGILILQAILAVITFRELGVSAAAANFGQAFGAIAALFAGLAFAGILYTIQLQQGEGNQRSFELLYFELMKRQREATAGVQAQFAGPHSDTFQGVPAFRSAVSELACSLSAEFSPTPPDETLLGFLQEAYDKICYQDYADFGHYFRNLFHLFLFIHERATGEGPYYAMLARAQLSNAELSLLFINGLSSQGSAFRPLIEEYAMLRGVRLPAPFEKYRRFYDQAAFGRSAAERPGTSLTG
jgi:hypothetical protein